MAISRLGRPWPAFVCLAHGRLAWKWRYPGCGNPGLHIPTNHDGSLIASLGPGPNLGLARAGRWPGPCPGWGPCSACSLCRVCVFMFVRGCSGTVKQVVLARCSGDASALKRGCGVFLKGSFAFACQVMGRCMLGPRSHADMFIACMALRPARCGPGPAGCSCRARGAC